MASFCSNCGAEIERGARFCASCGAPVGSDVPASRSGSDPAPQDEMRPVTALFADIVGSTRLAERLGPDEVKALVGECVTRMARSVEEFGGTVQAYMGDGICAYFGVPVAHGDDPERAARAALRILDMIRSYAEDVERAWSIKDFNVRVGINSGPAAVGIVGGATPEAVAVGDTMNVAARLQGSAAPGTIVVGAATMRHLTTRFELHPLGPVTLKGREQPVDAFRLLASRAARDRTPSRPLVGRSGELARLQQVAGHLEHGRGGILFITGEAGIGKSRLLRELERSSPSTTWLLGECASYEREIPYGPFVQMIRTWLDVDEQAHDLAVRTKLRAKVTSIGGGEGLVDRLAGLLSVRGVADRSPAEAHDAATDVRSGYRDWIALLAASRPVIVAIEDMHWCDAATAGLAAELLELTDRLPLLMAVTIATDPTSEGWRFKLHALADFSHRTSEIAVAPLEDAAAGELVDAAMPAGGLDDDLKRELVQRAEGNPLFLEELLRALLELGRGRKKTWALSSGSADELPSTIENLLVARVDRLPDAARRVVQVAAAAGRVFSAELVERVLGQPIQPELSSLLRSGIVTERGRYPELEYTFRHGLLHEAALATVTPRRLRQVYGQIAAAAEDLYADHLDDKVELLAFYYYRSDDAGRAVEYLMRAAQRASELGAPDRALELWERAAKAAARAGDGEMQTRALAEIHALGGGSHAARG